MICLFKIVGNSQINITEAQIETFRLAKEVKRNVLKQRTWERDTEIPGIIIPHFGGYLIGYCLICNIVAFKQFTAGSMQHVFDIVC